MRAVIHGSPIAYRNSLILVACLVRTTYALAVCWLGLQGFPHGRPSSFLQLGLLFIPLRRRGGSIFERQAPEILKVSFQMSSSSLPGQSRAIALAVDVCAAIAATKALGVFVVCLE